MMNPWLIAVIAASALLLIIMFSPIKYKLNFDYHDQLSLQSGISYGFFCNASIDKRNGISKIKLRILGIPFSLPTNKTPNKIKKHEPNSGSSMSWGLLRSFFQNKTYRPICHLMGRILNRIKPDYVIVAGQYGFYEPHYTAWLNVLLSLVPLKPPHYVLQLEPVWDDELLNIDEGIIKGSITIAGIAFNLLIFLFNPSTLRLLRDIRQAKKHKKKHNRIVLQPLS